MSEEAHPVTSSTLTLPPAPPVPPVVARPIPEGTLVSWQIDEDAPRGRGTVIGSKIDLVIVSVKSLRGEPFPGYHRVICCAPSWLKIEPAPEPVNPEAAAN